MARLNKTALHVASAKNDIQQLRRLLASGADINAKDAFDKTPLHIAVGMNKLEAVEFLLVNGARTDIKDSWGETPLSIACATFKSDSNKNYERIVELLLLYGADPNERRYSHTVLYIACLNRDANKVKLLLEYGANPNILTANGNSPLHVACEGCEMVLIIMTLSPQSAFGVNVVLCLPRSKAAASLATRPRDLPSASMRYHFLSTLDALNEIVFIIFS